MPFPSKTLAEPAALPPAPTKPLHRQLNPAHWPVAILALMMFLVPAVGVPSELMLQDTLKSALVAFGVLIAALVFFWQQRNRSQPLLWHGLVWLPMALMAYALGSMAWSHTYLAGVEAIRWFILSLLLWLGLNTLTRENLPLLLWGIHGGAVVASLWAVLQFWFDFSMFPQFAHPASTFGNRNFFAEYAVCALPFSVYVMVNLRASRWLGVAASTLAVNVVALMMTGTRSALVALLVLGPVLALILIRYRQQFAFRHWNRANQALVVLVLVFGVLGLGSIPSGNTKVIQETMGTTALQRSFLRAASMTEGKEYTERSFSIRATMWKATARMMMAHGLTGVGAGAWEVEIPLFQKSSEWIETDFYAHNEYLQLLSEYGLVVGGLVLAFLIAYLLIAVSRTWFLGSGDATEAPLRAITLVSLFALMLVSIVGFPWRLASTGALFVVCLGVLASSDARLGLQDAFYATSLRWRANFRRPILIMISCCLLSSAYITQSSVMAEYKIVRAIHLGNAILTAKAHQETLSLIDKTQMIQNVRESIAINPHHRNFLAMVADQLEAMGDLENAAWVVETIAASHRNVAALRSGLAFAYSRLGQHDRAWQQYEMLQNLKPDTVTTKEVELVLLSNSNREAEVRTKIRDYFLANKYSFEMTQLGYAVGIRTRDWPLAIESLERRNIAWPQFAADGYLKMGNIFSESTFRDDTKALEAYRLGLSATPPNEKNNFRDQVPNNFRSRL